MKEDLILFEKTDFDYVNPKAQVVIVGITPGNSQLEKSREGQSKREIKRINAFTGNMRPKLIAMLDHVGINKLLGIESCKSLWKEDFDKVEMTSLLKEATFYKGKMFNKAADIRKSKKLQEMLNNGFVKDCASYANSKLFIGLGKDVDTLLCELRDRGVIHAQIIGMPHPSGANSGPSKAFVDKEYAETKPKFMKYHEKSIICIDTVEKLIDNN